MGWKTWKGWVSFWRTTWSAGHETESVNLKYSPEDEVLKRTLTARFVGSMFVAKGNHKSMDWFCRWASLSRDVAWRQMKLSNFGFSGSPDLFDIQVVRQPVTSPAHEKPDSPFFPSPWNSLDPPRHIETFIHSAPKKRCVNPLWPQKRTSGGLHLSQNLLGWKSISSACSWGFMMNLRPIIQPSSKIIHKPESRPWHGIMGCFAYITYIQNLFPSVFSAPPIAPPRSTLFSPQDRPLGVPFFRSLNEPTWPLDPAKFAGEQPQPATVDERMAKNSLPWKVKGYFVYLPKILAHTFNIIPVTNLIGCAGERSWWLSLPFFPTIHRTKLCQMSPILFKWAPHSQNHDTW